ncbi:MAG: hypothetical protein AB4080_17550 [Trichodesmium sp.]
MTSDFSETVWICATCVSVTRVALPISELSYFLGIGYLAEKNADYLVYISISPALV